MEGAERLRDVAEFWFLLAAFVVLGLILAGVATLAGHPAAALLLGFLFPGTFVVDVLALRATVGAASFRSEGHIRGGGVTALGAMLLGMSVSLFVSCAGPAGSLCPTLDGIPVEWLLLWLGGAELVTGLRIVYAWSAVAERRGLHGALAGVGGAATGVLMLAELLAASGELAAIIIIAIIVILAALSWVLNVSVWVLVLGTIAGIIILGGVIGAAAGRAERSRASPAGLPEPPPPVTPMPPPASAPWGSARFCPLCGSPHILIAPAPHRQVHCNACGRDSPY